MPVSGSDIPWREGLKIPCSSCGEILQEKGAVMIAPPSEHILKVLNLDYDIDVCRKFHFCVNCYNEIVSKFIAPPKMCQCVAPCEECGCGLD